MCVWGKNVIRAERGRLLIKPGAHFQEQKQPRTCRLHLRQELDTVRRCSQHQLVFHLCGEKAHHYREKAENQWETAANASHVNLLTVKVSLILKLQSTWLMSLAWRKPFPRTTTWKVSGYKTHRQYFIFYFIFITQNNTRFIPTFKTGHPILQKATSSNMQQWEVFRPWHTYIHSYIHQSINQSIQYSQYSQ